jgi:2'-5' RNA ligase
MVRLFTAIEIPSRIGESLALLRGGLPGARWIDSENYHLTLRFIGEIDDDIGREIAFMLGTVKRHPFDLRIDGLSSFGGRQPRALVASVPAVPALLDLQADHDRIVRRIGIEADRKYIPHVTLARLRGSSNRQVADYLSARLPFRSADFPVSRFVLYSSRASLGGGPYVVEAEYPLAV